MKLFKKEILISPDGDSGATHNPGVVLKNNDYTDLVTPAYTQYWYMNGFDKNNALIMTIGAFVSAQKNAAAYMAVKNANGSESLEVLTYYQSNGDKFFRPEIDNNMYLGGAYYRWKQLCAATATIATSDERYKDSVSSIPDSVLDAWEEVGFVQYKFKDAIEEKGNNARLHSGLIAQHINEVFNIHGLDASKYGLFCYDSWDASPEIRNGDIIVEHAREAGDRYSLRYEEALCMEAAYQRRENSRLKARISDLEERLASLENKLKQ